MMIIITTIIVIIIMILIMIILKVIIVALTKRIGNDVDYHIINCNHNNNNDIKDCI